MLDPEIHNTKVLITGDKFNKFREVIYLIYFPPI